MKKTFKFGDLSVYHNNKYYFPMNITEIANNAFQIQVVYFDRGKWYQDTATINQDLKNKLQKFL
jgi:hypothetical protein